MKASDIPLRFTKVFGQDAGGAYIRTVPVASQIGVTDGAASFTDGFPPLTMTPQIAGGVPPFGQDENGIINIITKWNQWGQAGGAVPWDSTFSAAIAGYPAGAVAAAATFGYFWVSLVDDNTSDPDTGGANWTSFTTLGSFTTGDAKVTLKASADPGWIFANDGSIGNASSGATTRANADTAALFSLEWNNISNSFAQVQDSAGTPVSRGVSAAADFAANRRILVPKVLGRALTVAGAGAGLTARALGDGTLGVEFNVVAQSNLPSLTFGTAIASGQGNHAHALSNGTAVLRNAGTLPLTQTLAGTLSINDITVTASTLPAMSGTTPTGGAGLPLTTIQPSTAWNFMIKL